MAPSEADNRQLELPVLGNYAHPKLVVFLVDPQASSGAQWEDVHRALAIQLRLSTNHLVQQTPFVWDSQLPRYLLATDDRQWAIHEMVSALEAMDCPIEQL